MGLNNHAQRSTPPYYLDVDNPFDKKLFQFMSNEILKMVNPKKVLLLSEGKEFFIIFLHIMTRLYRVFFLNWPPLNFLSTNSLYILCHLEKFLYLENLGGTS